MRIAAKVKLQVTDIIVVKCCIALKTDVTIERGRRLVADLDRSHADKLISSLLKLEILSADERVDAGEYYDGMVICADGCVSI